MLVIEGADNSGKSTLAKELAKRLNLHYVHPGGPPKTEDERMMRLSEQLYLTNCRLLYDRVTCISDPIYRGRMEDPIFLAFQSAMVNTPDFVLIYCKPPKHILMDVQNHAVKSHDTVEQVELIKRKQETFIENYDDIMSRLPHITYDFTVDTIEDLLRRINART